MNSINWSAAPNGMGLHNPIGRAKAEDMGSNPVETLEMFSSYNLQLLKLRLITYSCDDHILISVCGNVRTFHFFC